MLAVKQEAAESCIIFKGINDYFRTPISTNGCDTRWRQQCLPSICSTGVCVSLL